VIALVARSLSSPAITITISTASTEYAPYGQQMRPAPYERDTTQEFTSQERDEVSGLDYFKQRYYQPQYGRFNRPDPVRDFDLTNPAGFNLYAYVRGNPVNFTDPMGTLETDDPRGAPGRRVLPPDISGEINLPGLQAQFGNVQAMGKVENFEESVFEISLGPFTFAISRAPFGRSKDLDPLEKVTVKLEYGVSEIKRLASNWPELFAITGGATFFGIEMGVVETPATGWVYTKLTPYSTLSYGIRLGKEGNRWSNEAGVDINASYFTLENFLPWSPNRS
jgi:RHS repeat-associated protein